MKKKTIALLIRYNEQRLHIGIARYARQANWSLYRTEGTLGRSPDGIISFHHRNPEQIELIQSCGVPVVELNVPTRGVDIPCVIHDNKTIGNVAGRYFLSQGFQSIAYARAGNHPNDTDRMKGLSAVLQKEGRELHEITFDRLETQLLALPQPCGVMCPNDMHAVNAIRMALDLGLRVPQDIAILGVDDDQLQCELSPVPLSSVNTNFEGVGYRAAQLLDQLMNGEPAPKHAIMIPPLAVITRESTDLCAVPHQPVAKALNILKGQFKTQLSLNAVATSSGMCRRRLEDAFRKYINHGMRDELTRLRLAHARYLLRTTDLSAGAIAHESGFSSPEVFTRIFKRECNTTPGAFRKLN